MNKARTIVLDEQGATAAVSAGSFRIHVIGFVTGLATFVEGRRFTMSMTAAARTT